MFNQRWIKRSKIRAIHDDHLETYLSSIGVLAEITAGTKLCKFCNSQINIENIGAIFPVEDKIEIICDKPKCLIQINISEELK